MSEIANRPTGYIPNIDIAVTVPESIFNPVPSAVLPSQWLPPRTYGGFNALRSKPINSLSESESRHDLWKRGNQCSPLP